jgi:uncharacterized protein YecE (DUF72 family)
MALLSDPRKEAYLQWLVTAPSEREFKTVTEFAASVGVHRRTVYDWRQEKEFLAEWDERARAIAGDPEKTTMLLDALFKQAVDADSPKQVQAAKAWADIAGVIKPPKQQAKQDGLSADLSKDEIDKLLIELLSQRDGVQS